VNSNEPVENGCEVRCEMFHILNCGSSKLLAFVNNTGKIKGAILEKVGKF